MRILRLVIGFQFILNVNGEKFSFKVDTLEEGRKIAALMLGGATNG